MGRIGHPHLIRVHHLTRNGVVFLRDIKRWLADLRRKGMPETFTWSFKRRYKKGYIWQDLLDDDLDVTPNSENGEYVLKASQILSPHDHNSSFDPPPSPYFYAAENKTCLPESEFEEAAFEMQTSFDVNQQSNKVKSSIENSCFYSKLLLKKKKKSSSKELGSGTTSTTTSSSSPSSQNSSPQSQSVPIGKTTHHDHQSRRPLSMFRNLINCGAVETKDSVFIRLNRSRDNNNKNKPPLTNRSSASAQDIIIIRRKKKREKAPTPTVGSAGLFGTCMGAPDHTTTNACKSDDRRNPKTASSAYRPIRGPHCSHCRKHFKPEKLHSHMKSCKGMTARSKTSPPASAMP